MSPQSLGYGCQVHSFVEPETPVPLPRIHVGRVSGLACTARGHVASCGADGRVILWDFLEGKEVRKSEMIPRLTGGFSSLCVTSGGRTLVAGAADGRIFLFETRTMRIVATLITHTASVTSLCPAAESLIASAGKDKRVRAQFVHCTDDWLLSNSVSDLCLGHKEERTSVPGVRPHGFHPGNRSFSCPLPPSHFR